MKKVFFFLLSIFLIFSCKSVNDKKNNAPSKTTSSFRLNDIEKKVHESPVIALNQIYIYKEVYSAANNKNKNENEDEDWRQLAQYEKTATENLCAMQEKAIEEEQWDDAVSLGRSIASLGIKNAHTGKEAEFILAGAKKKLKDGNNLGAFLSAVKAHEIKPLDYQSALLFLEKASGRAAAPFFGVFPSRGSGGRRQKHSR